MNISEKIFVPFNRASVVSSESGVHLRSLPFCLSFMTDVYVLKVINYLDQNLQYVEEK